MGAVTVVVVIAVVAVLLVFAGLRRARSRRPAHEETPHQQGLNALIAGDRDAAMRHFARAVRDDPRNTDAYVRLGDLLRERGQMRQAIQIHRELLVKRRLPAQVRCETQKSLAKDLAKAERWKEVLDTLATLPRSERSDPTVLAMTRDAHEAVGDFDRALSTHREMLKTKMRPEAGEPSPGVYRAHLGLLALKNGDRKRAKAELAAALKEDAGAYLANMHLGDIASLEKDNERAVAYWMKLVTENPECAYLVFERLEKAYFEMGDFGRMMGIYENLVSKSPSNVRALAGLSRMLERKGSIEEALRFAREAVKHETDAREGHRQLIEILARNGRFEEAAEATRSLLDSLPGKGGQPTCPSCGAPVPERGWRCQSCRSWIHEC